AAPAPAADPASARSPRLALHVGPGVLIYPGGDISPGGTAIGGARWKLAERAGGELVAPVPVVPSAIESPQGRARLSAVVSGAGAWIDLLASALPVTMAAGAGIAAGFLSYYGQPDSGDVRARDGTVPYALPFARWGIAWRLYPPLALRGDLLAGVAAPRPVIRLAGRESDVAFGRPLVSFGIGVEVAIR